MKSYINLSYGLALSAIVIMATHLAYKLDTSIDKPKFKIGDCISMEADKVLESWEMRPRHIEKIVAVGRAKYRVVVESDNLPLYLSDSKFYYEDIMVKVPCTDRLNAYEYKGETK